MDSGESELWARRDHQHAQPQLPRWLRWVALVVAALTLLVIFLAILLGQQASRIDGLEDYVQERREQVDAERLEDLRRTRLTICDLIVNVPAPGTVDAARRLQCPPAGAEVYEELGEPPYGD